MVKVGMKITHKATGVVGEVIAIKTTNWKKVINVQLGQTKIMVNYDDLKKIFIL